MHIATVSPRCHQSVSMVLCRRLAVRLPPTAFERSAALSKRAASCYRFYSAPLSCPCWQSSLSYLTWRTKAGTALSWSVARKASPCHARAAAAPVPGRRCLGGLARPCGPGGAEDALLAELLCRRISVFACAARRSQAVVPHSTLFDLQHTLPRWKSLVHGARSDKQSQRPR